FIVVKYPIDRPMLEAVRIENCLIQNDDIQITLGRELPSDPHPERGRKKRDNQGEYDPTFQAGKSVRFTREKYLFKRSRMQHFAVIFAKNMHNTLLKPWQ
ncbi:MAG: hypothetical protein ACKO7B_03335, partial [Flavobacteriales bacterium]